MGKTRLRNVLLKENPSAGYMVASSDDHLEKVAAEEGKTYNGVWDDHIKDASKACSRAIHEAVELKRSVIIDQMHGKAASRRPRVERARSAKYGVRCIAFRPPPEGSGDEAEWRQRLQERPGKIIPEDKLEMMIEEYTLPSLDEGFDMIAVVDFRGHLLYME